ncbi:polysaccharide deacetylase family protein [Micromonospora sp. NPDC000089]|uniref:polysaccharide deacetylase family protein n=1 Tax=unclassified Micromonospora TaxID=2617518 RepID=UPI00368CB89F
MRAGSTGRTVGIVVLVLAALLGSAYALGRSLIPDTGRPRTGAAHSVDGPQYADQGPEPGARHDGPPPPSAGGPETGQQAEGGPQADGGSSADGHRLAEGLDDTLYGARVTTGSDEVALTFDDGPDPTYTPQVLAVLRAYQVKATFCVVGQNAQDHPELIQEIVADGHTLCNHSWSHDVTLGKRSPAAIRADLTRTNDAIHAAVPDAHVGWFRQPGGAWTSPVVQVARELGMAPLHWTVDPNDWKAPGAPKITASVTGDTQAGSIVLMHDAGGNRQGTVDALHRILPDLGGRFRLEALPPDGVN